MNNTTATLEHIGLHLRRNRRPLAETMEEIAQFVPPVFHDSAAHEKESAVLA